MESKYIVTAYVEANDEFEAREVLQNGDSDKMSIFSVEKLIVPQAQDHTLDNQQNERFTSGRDKCIPKQEGNTLGSVDTKTKKTRGKTKRYNLNYDKIRESKNE